MGRFIENHVRQGMVVNHFYYDSLGNRPCDYQIQEGVDHTDQPVLVRAIQEFDDALNVILRKAFSKGVYHTTVRHSTKEDEWRIHLEHLKKQIAYITYSKQGIFRTAEIFKNNARFLLKRSQTPPVSLQTIFYDDFSHRYQLDPSPLSDAAVLFHPESQTTFKADWNDYDNITLTITNQKNRNIKKCTFPFYLPVRESNVFHEHLENIIFPFELIRLHVHGENGEQELE